MKIATLFASLSLFLACGGEGPVRSVKNESVRCEQPLTSRAQWDLEHDQDPFTWAKDHGVIPLGDGITEQMIIDLNGELKKVPEEVFDHLLNTNFKMETYVGQSINDKPGRKSDPSINSSSGVVVGIAGGIGSTNTQMEVVINANFNGGLGSLTLHEIGHLVHEWLTEFGVDWEIAFVDNNLEERQIFIDKFGSYFIDPNERFAEMFSGYFGCEKSKDWVLKTQANSSQIFSTLEQEGFPVKQ